MSTTNETMQQDQEDFAAAFAGPDEVKPEQTEDEAFGLGPVEEPEEVAESVAEEVPAEPEAAESGSAGDAGDDAQGAAPAVVVAIEPSENSNAEPQDEKDLQRQKSWEGRLKAREAELKAREEAIAAREGDGEATAESVAEEPGAAAALENAAEQVESGELTIEQALKGLSNDFGEDFTKMLGVLIKAQASEIASKTADERVGEVHHKMDGLVGEISEDRARSHFESISDAHPDFMDVAQAPEFKEFIGAMDETQQARANAVIERGTAREIIKLISSYKAAAKPAEPQADPEQEAALDDAEGVRTSGLKLPEKPAISDDYSEAWDQF